MTVSTTKVEKVEDDFLSSIPNTLGSIIEFSSKSSIDSADVTIKYDENELKSKGLNEDNLSIYYINETDLKLEKINTIIDKNNKTLTCEFKHFSKYLVGDSSKIISDLTEFDIIFAIDKSGSMAWNDAESKRIDVCENLVNDYTFRKKSYRFGSVSFDSDASPTTFKDSETTYLTNNHSYVID